MIGKSALVREVSSIFEASETTTNTFHITPGYTLLISIGADIEVRSRKPSRHA